jgi:hypothetical protein
MWLLSPRVLPIIMLVVIPFAVSLVVLILNWFGYPVAEIGSIRLAFGERPLSLIISGFYFICIAALVYGFYPIKFSNLKRRGFTDLITEYKYIKNILYAEVPILIVVTIIIVAQFTVPSFGLNNLIRTIVWGEDFPFCQKVMTTNTADLFEQLRPENQTKVLGAIAECIDDVDILIRVGINLAFLINGLMVNLGLSVTAGIIYVILIATKKDIRYHMAKACFEAIPRQKNQTNKVNYFIMGVKFYDKYLRRALNIQINDVKKIYSKIISDPNAEAMDSIMASFDNDEDKLRPVKFFTKMLNIKKTEEFLIDVSFGQKLKDMAIFFATIIPVAVGIIQLLLPKE